MTENETVNEWEYLDARIPDMVSFFIMDLWHDNHAYEKYIPTFEKKTNPKQSHINWIRKLKKLAEASQRIVFSDDLYELLEAFNFHDNYDYSDFQRAFVLRFHDIIEPKNIQVKYRTEVQKYFKELGHGK